MRTCGWIGVAIAVAVAPSGCAPADRTASATARRSQDALATQPAADAVIHINGLSCPF